MLVSLIVWLFVTIFVGVLLALCEYHSFDAIFVIVMFAFIIIALVMAEYFVPTTVKYEQLLIFGFMLLSMAISFVVCFVFGNLLKNRNLRK